MHALLKILLVGGLGFGAVTLVKKASAAGPALPLNVKPSAPLPAPIVPATPTTPAVVPGPPASLAITPGASPGNPIVTTLAGGVTNTLDDTGMSVDSGGSIGQPVDTTATLATAGDGADDLS